MLPEVTVGWGHPRNFSLALRFEKFVPINVGSSLDLGWGILKGTPTVLKRRWKKNMVGEEEKRSLRGRAWGSELVLPTLWKRAVLGLIVAYCKTEGIL